MLTTLSACAGSPKHLQSNQGLPSLPPKPAGYGQPVKIPKPRVGEDPVGYSGRVIVSHQKANKQLERDGEFYDDVQREFSRSAGEHTGDGE